MSLFPCPISPSDSFIIGLELVPRELDTEGLGRLAKTRHILAFVDDERLRRRVLVGLNRQESIHAMARAIFYGRQGRFGDRGSEAQLNRASALSLVINAIVVWNTRYLTAAATELERRAEPVPQHAWQHISPLIWQHVHLVGTYSFDEPTIEGELRPLRNDVMKITTPADLKDLP
ncbi:MAG: transposase [Actinobacteria bacterium]|nr:transposase [Actinomycetota bacterium]